MDGGEGGQFEEGERRLVKKKMKKNLASRKSEVYYMKKSDWKRMEMKVKLEELKKSGRDTMVNKVLSKKRKKEGSKYTNFYI